MYMHQTVVVCYMYSMSLHAGCPLYWSIQHVLHCIVIQTPICILQPHYNKSFFYIHHCLQHGTHLHSCVIWRTTDWTKMQKEDFNLASFGQKLYTQHTLSMITLLLYTVKLHIDWLARLTRPTQKQLWLWCCKNNISHISFDCQDPVG